MKKALPPFPLSLDGHSLKFNDIENIALGIPISISNDAKKRIKSCRKKVLELIKDGSRIYGVNTGFGYFANTEVDGKKCKALQHNLLLSHASGHGDPLSIAETRLAMTLRLNVLTKGLTGVRWELCEQLLKLIHAEIYPIVPEKGSVGASGDLAPLAHLALPIIGQGKVRYEGRTTSAASALKSAGLSPLVLEEKEGLSLINGTQIMLAVGGHALHEALILSHYADKIAALTFEALEGRMQALHLPLHRARGQVGQIETAKALKAELKGVNLSRKKRYHTRLQDPYSLRCIPQIHGPSKDSLKHAKTIIERELNAATDNPLVFEKESRIINGGNFHGQALAMAFDIAAMALSELGNVSERRLELMLNPQFSGLAAFLSPEEGFQSGYMASQYLSASLVSESKLLANPACTDSIPGNVGVEDFVSMGMTSAHKLKQIVKNLRANLAIELLAAAQAFDLRNLDPRGAGTKQTYAAIRHCVPTLKKDRIVSYDIDKAVDLLLSEGI
ncbi:Histidine ammonia-lyase [Chlamydiales bacterium SCGC AG-110-M15]|nr:Histidine ammonia-lyase [Chlamydiales bacterium SCGC AG-110-M15]